MGIVKRSWSSNRATVDLLDLIAALENRTVSGEIKSLIIDKARVFLADENVSGEHKTVISALIAETVNSNGKQEEE